MRFLLVALFAATAAAQNTLVVTPDEFRPALKEWKAYREAQGHTITIKAPSKDLDRKGFDFLVIVGDVKQVPCSTIQAEIIRSWDRHPKIASDNHLADVDGDNLPDLALGRIPADNPAEAAAMLRKSIRYEKNADFSAWRRRVNVIAGIGGFGKLQDWAIEQAATRFLSQNIPYHYDLHVTYCNPNSPFCPAPADVTAIALKRFNEGAFFVAYLGHGSIRNLDRMWFNKRRYPIFPEDSAYELKAQRGAPMVLLSCCSSGSLDATPDCLAEVMLKQEQGPVVIMASSRVSMPYGNGALAKELLAAVFEDRVRTIGEAFQQAKVRLMKPRKNDEGRQFIEMLAMPYQPDAKKREKERYEHLFLYNLFGDPTVRIPHVQRIELSWDGETLKGKSPIGGEATIEWVAERKVPALRRDDDTPESFRSVYKKANQRTSGTKTATLKAGAFEMNLPGKPDGRAWIRVYVQGKATAAAGSIEVKE